MSSTHEQQLKEALDNLLKIIPSYQKPYFYNCSLIDPYLLTSHGLQISNKRLASSQSNSRKVQDHAVCTSNSCDLSVQFDAIGNLQEKEDLNELLHDHDSQCPYLKVKGNIINFKLFSELGRSIYEENLSQLISKRIWIQLNPKQIKYVVLNFDAKKRQFNPTLEQLKQLDINIKGQALTKVTSSIYLALFGWQWAEKNIMACRFCGSSRDVSQYISPLQCSLLKVNDGFSFLSSHQSWCCLIQHSQNYWQQILRQAVIGELQRIQGNVSRTSADLQCKNIQRNLIQIYRDHISRMGLLRKELQDNRQSIKQKYGGKQELCQLMEGHLQILEAILDEQKQAEEGLIQNVRLKS